MLCFAVLSRARCEASPFAEPSLEWEVQRRGEGVGVSERKARINVKVGKACASVTVGRANGSRGASSKRG